MGDKKRIRKKTTLKDLPPHNKPREKLSERGSPSLSDEELLAIILRTGYKGRSAIDLARSVLRKYPLEKLYKIPLEELKKIKGIGEAKATSLKAIFELAERISKKLHNPPVIDSPLKVAELVWEIGEKKKEVFVVLYLNARKQLVRKEVISVGTLEESLVHPREVFKIALENPTSSLILVHNHPSGDPEPSEEDIRITHRLVEAGKIMGIEVLDHVIISKNGFVSLRERNLLK